MRLPLGRGSRTKYRPGRAISRSSSHLMTSEVSGRLAFAAGPLGSKCKAQQVLNQVALLAIRKTQAHAGVVMVNDTTQCREAPIMIKPALEVRKQITNRRRPIT